MISRVLSSSDITEPITTAPPRVAYALGMWVHTWKCSELQEPNLFLCEVAGHPFLSQLPGALLFLPTFSTSSVYGLSQFVRHFQKRLSHLSFPTAL